MALIESVGWRQEPMTHFGEHVTYDGYGCKPELLDSKTVVSEALIDLVDELGMTRLGGPEIYAAPANAIKDPGGWTGVVVLQESHISVHTFPARAFLSADVYTCQSGLDVELIRYFLQQRFRATDDEVNFLKRGTRYPTSDLHPDRIRPIERSDAGAGLR